MLLSAGRRRFLKILSLLTGGAFLTSTSQAMTTEKTFIHHVYFWLQRPGDAGDLQKLIEGLKRLSRVSTIQSFHIGRPADTNRDVIDRSYAVSWCTFFRSPEDQEAYQTDPIHKRFVEECASLWSKVVVYDSIDI
jgi:hypothetical protein